MNSQPIIIYKINDNIHIDVTISDNNIWLSQDQMAELFGKSRSTINEHIKNIYTELELEEPQTLHKFGNTEFQQKKTNYYNLDMVFAVGYRVKSPQGIKFRTWASGKLKEYIIQGFSINTTKITSGKSTEYFDKLQDKLREIRLSERLFYQKIKDIYTTSIDYNLKDDQTIMFFKIVQNKLLRAISEKTAAELVYNRIDSNLPLLGMQSFDKNKNHNIIKKDIITAKNYLNESEIKILGLLVEQYLAFAETMAQAQIPMKMADWIKRLDVILELNQKNILNHSGKISHTLAEEKAEIEYNMYKQKQKQNEYIDIIQELESDIKSLAKSK